VIQQAVVGLSRLNGGAARGGKVAETGKAAIYRRQWLQEFRLKIGSHDIQGAAGHI
jgi:hypothetical protein